MSARASGDVGHQTGVRRDLRPGADVQMTGEARLAADRHEVFDRARSEELAQVKPIDPGFANPALDRVGDIIAGAHSEEGSLVEPGGLPKRVADR